MADYYTLLTNAGIAYENACKAAGVAIKLTQMSVGDGNGAVYNPAATDTALRREVWRGPLNALFQDGSNPSWLLAEVTIPPEVGGWYVREAGLWTDTGILYAIVKYPESFKPVLASSGSGKEFYIRSIFETSNASQVTLLIDDTVVRATRAWVMSYLVDELAKLDGKQSVRVATTGNIVLSGAQQIDGVAVVSGQRVLVVAQASAKDNGIYVVANGAWVRSADSNSSAKVTPGLTVIVEEGTANGDSLWHLVTNGPITLDTTALTFEMLAGRTGVLAGKYSSLTVDKYGRVTAGENPPAIDALARSVVLTASTVLTVQQVGLLLLDATAAACTFTLPSSAALGGAEVMLRRVDATANALIISAAGTDKIMLDTVATVAGLGSTELLFSGDYLCLRSDGAGKWWCVGQAQLPASLEKGVSFYKVAGSFTYTVPPVLRSGRKRARVQLVGAGGQGGYNSTGIAESNGRGSGGGSGGYSEGLVSLAGVASVPVVVGSGGPTLKASSFGAYMSATGGAAGTNYGGASSAGGGPGTGTGGDINLGGGSGSDGPVQGGGGTGGSGDGAASYFGGGSRSASGWAYVPVVPGSGCGGSGLAGLVNGADGAVIISW